MNIKRAAAGLLAVILIFTMQLCVFAIGWEEHGDFSWNNNVMFRFEPSDSVLVYNKEVNEYIDYDEIYTGSVMYVPIEYSNLDNGNEGRATMKMVKDENVAVSYKAITGAQYIKDVTIVDAKKDKIKNIDSGAYAKIEFSNLYTGTNYAYVRLRIVLSINKVGYQETEAELICNLRNILQYINKNSVYPAQVPTKFEVTDRYDGEVTFDMGDKVKYTAKVGRAAKYVINYDRTPDYDLSVMYPKAYMEYYNFLGDHDTFASTGSLEIPINKPKFKGEDGQYRVFAYEILDGKLRAIDSRSGSYDAKKQVLTIRTQTLGKYVLTNTKLYQDVEAENDQTFQSGYAIP